MFSSDKREILAKADGIRSEGITFFSDDDPAYLRIYGNQLIALAYSIRTLKDMPGRKIIFFMTPNPDIFTPLPDFTKPTEDGERVITRTSERKTNYNERYGNHFDKLADEALRAGVVVHSMDTNGLESEDRPNALINARNTLPARTGGLYIANSNFFLNGIGEEANNMIAGYYLVSYIPSASTFELSNKDIYHRVNIKVKRKGAVVHTRDGFYSRPENETDSVTPPVNHLVNAIFSPFRYTDLNVNMAAGYIKGEPGIGILPADSDVRGLTVIVKSTVGGSTIVRLPDYLVRAWIHLDPRDVKIVETEDGGARIELETLLLASDINGSIQDFRETKYTSSIKPEKKSETIAWIQQHGIRFTLVLPVKKPGAYTVHIAVKDTGSDKVGSAYQFIEIPNLKRKRLDMSSIFMLTNTEDLVWINSDAKEKIAGGVFFLTFQDGVVRSPALRTYASGDILQTLAMLYNADEKDVARSEIEIQSFIYKDGREFLRSESKPITPDNAKTPDNIMILQRLTTGSDLPPGDYVLQLLATDKKHSKKKEKGGIFSEGLFSKILRTYLGEEINYDMNGIASQTMSFTILED